LYRAATVTPLTDAGEGKVWNVTPRSLSSDSAIVPVGTTG
jgi:hypothetical protein